MVVSPSTAWEHDTDTPDIHTASDGYAGRFAGAVGRWLLSEQERGVRYLLGDHWANALDVLEVGGGHAQLTKCFLSSGHRVTAHGSSQEALARLTGLRREYGDQLRLLVSDLWQLPCADRSFDLVVGVRLLAHVEDWQGLLREMVRVARRFVIVDYPPLSSPNLLTPLVFRLKRRVEGNTRPYFCYWGRRLEAFFRAEGFKRTMTYRQFAVPMGLHRALGQVGLSRRIETVLRTSGVTGLIGSPALLMASRGNNTQSG